MPKSEEKKEQDTFNSVIAALDALETEPSKHLSIQLDDRLRAAIRAAQSSGQAAAVTLKITVKRGPDRRVVFTPNLTAKLPNPPVSAVTLYADDDGEVHKSDPAQLPIPNLAPVPFNRNSNKE